LSKEKNEDAWIICPVCKTKLKKNNIPNHMKYVHNKKIEDFDESSIKILPKKRQKQKKSMNISIGPIVIILVVIIVVVFFVLSGSPDDSNNSGNSNNSRWIDNYSSVHSIGTGSNNFWINFPVGNPSVGQSVEHLTWITEDLEEKPVVFVVHKTGCAACTPQADRIKDFREIYSEHAIFYDLDIPLGGDIEKKAYESFYYDPNGGDHYIALTGVFTLINEGGEIKIGWHSWEGDVDDVTMENWIKDAIYYYHINSEVK
jgi:hypothetical protein